MAESGETFWDHLDALRRILLRIAAVMIILGIGAFCVMPWLFDTVIMAPCSASFPTYVLFNKLASYAGLADLATEASFNVDIVSIELASQLFIHLSASGWIALVAGFPIVIYLLWTFIAPGLYPHEKVGIKKAFVFGNIMFYFGVAIGYFLVFPLCVRFLADYRLSDAIRPIVSLDSYMDNFFTLLLMMGAVFELPLLSWLLGKIGILTKDFFNKYRRHAIVVLLIIAALITPTGDPFTLFIVFIPIYGLWELSSCLVPKVQEESEP